MSVEVIFHLQSGIWSFPHPNTTNPTSDTITNPSKQSGKKTSDEFITSAAAPCLQQWVGKSPGPVYSVQSWGQASAAQPTRWYHKSNTQVYVTYHSRQLHQTP